MKDPKAQSDDTNGLSTLQIVLAVFGLVAPVLTFVLAVSSFSEEVKIFLLVVLAAGYSSIILWTFQRSRDEREVVRKLPVLEEDDLETSLESIGEASEFFGSSLKPSDMFRLVSSRVSHVFPFELSALLVSSESGDALEVAQAEGPGADKLLNKEIPIDNGLAGIAWISGEVELDPDLALERKAISREAVFGMRSAAAIPLMHDSQAFAVLVLYTSRTLAGDDETISTLDRIGKRVAPLFLSSISYERTVANALTDSLTNLPNERAFYMVLENQLAESQRFRNERPLTVLTVDIKNFAEANQNFGFAAGDRMLEFTAQQISSQLRKMDFLSRSGNDEFLIILPTASEKFAAEIMRRIRDRFASEAFHASETDDIKIWLNFGWATFWQDGETVEQLLQNARIRKQQAKAEEPTKVLWFPKEYVN